MTYIKTEWKNDSVPAINATNLNKIEEGIYQAHQNIENIKLPEIQNEESVGTDKVYSCDYINKLNTYLPKEHVIGTWVNGKPIYRRVIDIDTITLVNGTNTIEHGISNLEAVVKMDMMLRYTNENWYHTWDSYGTITVGYNIISIDVSAGTSNTFNDGHIILEYTKTTD